MGILKFNPFKSMTIIGAIGVIGTYVVASYDPTALSPTAHTILLAVSGLVGALGIRNAVAKAVIQILEQLAAK